MKAKLINEYIDYAGRWIPEKVSAVDKGRSYFYQQELRKKILDLIDTYKEKIDRSKISEIITDLLEKYPIKNNK